MIIFPLLSFTSFLLYLFFGAYGYLQDRHSLLNRQFLFMCLSLAVWSFGMTFYYAAPDETACFFWFKCFSVGWYFFPGFLIHFSLVLVWPSYSKLRRILHPFLYVIPIILTATTLSGHFIIESFSRSRFGWYANYKSGSPLYLINAAYDAVSMLVSIAFIGWWRFITKRIREKKQATIILTSFIPVAFLAGLTGIVLPWMSGVKRLPPLVPVIITFWMFGIWWAISRYRLMALTPSLAADRIVSRILDMVVLVDTDGKIIQINESVERTLGHAAHSLLGAPYTVLSADPYFAGQVSGIGGRTGIQSAFETEFRDSAGEMVPVMVSASPVADNLGEPIGVILVCRDIRQTRALENEILRRERSERDLRGSEEKFNRAFRSSPLPMVIADLETGALLDLNRSALDQARCSREEAVGKSFYDLVEWLSAGRRERFIDALHRYGFVRDWEIVFVVKGGIRRIISASAEMIMIENAPCFILNAVDITEQRHLEEERRRAQNLESIGILAGGIAHDFNNILTAIYGSISLARRHAEPGGKLHSILDKTEKASNAAKALTRQLLTFSKGGGAVFQPADIADLLRETVSFALHGSSVRVIFSIAEDLRPANADLGQIGQVINNLAINALQAMPGGGTLAVSAGNASVRGSGIYLPERPGSYLRISIRDTGSGISPEHLGRIFDPYFTTKETGSGLGLAIVYSIIKNHKGYIFVDSEPGKGTEFIMFLPASEGLAGVGASPDDAFSCAGGRVLLMDDDEYVVETAKMMLEDLGCEVQTAREGGEAVRRYAEAMENGKPFDVVIMDLTVPGGMGGLEAIRELLKIDPDARALMSSGYSTDAVMTDYASYGFAGAVPKPYTIEDLGRVLGLVLR